METCNHRHHPLTRAGIAAIAGMARITGIAAIAALLGAACTPPQSAPPWSAHGGDMSSLPQGAPYDPRSVVNVHGAVVRVDDPGGETVTQLPVVLLVSSDHGTVRVELAPRWYLARERIVVAPGDVVDVVGTSEAREGGDRVVRAHELRRGNDRVLLQPEAGDAAPPPPAR